MNRMLENIRTLAIVCYQWGDTGKGKLVDCFANRWADIIARGTGGANAGHTIKIGDKVMIFHLAPSGLMCPGRINIIGNGVVLDPRMLCEEIRALESHGVSCRDRLFIAHNAKLVLPQHMLLDQLRDMAAKGGKIGSTGRGISPAYADFPNRTALFVNDLLNPDRFMEKLRIELDEYLRLFRSHDKGAVRQIMANKRLGGGRFYSESSIISAEEVAQAYLAAGRILAPMIKDTDEYIRKNLGKKNILLEGAQGTLLSLNHGTYPYVTASDSSLDGLAKGVGLSSRQVDMVLGIVKAPYMTRVGEGPFPTEMGGDASDRWCGSESPATAEANHYGSVREMEAANDRGIGMDETDEYKLGVAIRIAGDEYGATTGRPRRIGWLDLPLLRYAKQFNGPDAILTKLDVMSTCPTIKVCVAYEYMGPDYRIADRVLRSGDRLETAIPAAEVLRHCKPIYEELPGWMTDISGISSWDGLPPELTRLIEFISSKAEVTIRVLSVGSDRDQTIFA